MSAGVGVLPAVAALRRLYGRTDDEVIRDIQTAAQRLSIATRSWSTLMPSRTALDEAQNAVAGLQRAMVDLGTRMQNGGPPDAA